MARPCHSAGSTGRPCLRSGQRDGCSLCRLGVRRLSGASSLVRVGAARKAEPGEVAVLLGGACGSG